jgi:threonine dehydratase
VGFGPAAARRFLKAESLQPIGAFKLRGAYVAVASLAAAERERGVITAERSLAITIGLELVDDLVDLAAVLVPIGGGGLASGVATAIKALRPDVRVIGVEPELAADARDSLARGEIVRWPAELVSRTIADGARTQALGVRTFAHLRAYLDEIVTVSEAEIAAGVRLAAERSRLVVEPSGALSIAAMAFHRRELGLSDVRGSVVAVVSGGNVDPDRYREFLTAPIPDEG